MFSPQTLTIFVILAAKGQEVERPRLEATQTELVVTKILYLCVLTRFDESRSSTPGRNAAFKSV